MRKHRQNKKNFGKKTTAQSGNDLEIKKKKPKAQRRKKKQRDESTSYLEIDEQTCTQVANNKFSFKLKKQAFRIA